MLQDFDSRSWLLLGALVSLLGGCGDAGGGEVDADAIALDLCDHLGGCEVPRVAPGGGSQAPSIDIESCKASPFGTLGIAPEDMGCIGSCLLELSCEAVREALFDHGTSCNCPRAGAQTICDKVAECGSSEEFDHAACLAHPGRTLDLPDEQIPCLAQCLGEHSCDEAPSACDNEREGTACYQLYQ